MPEKLSNRSVERLIAAGKAGDYRCSATRGLVLRVKGSGVYTWCVRRSLSRRDFRLDLGNLWTLDEARELAFEVDRRIKSKHDPWILGPESWAAYLDKRRREKLGVPPAPPPAPKKPPPPPTVGYDAAVELYRAELGRTRRKSTAYAYCADLTGREMQRFMLRDVSGITRQQVAEAIAEIHRRGAERKANTTAVAVRGMFKFLGRDDMTRKTGVEHGRMKELRAPEDTWVEEEDDDGSNRLYVPDAPAVGTLVRGLRAERKGVSERDRLAGLLIAYSVQRRSACISAWGLDADRRRGHGISRCDHC